MKINMSPDELIIKQKTDLPMAKIYGLDAWMKKTATSPDDCEQLSNLLKTYKKSLSGEMGPKLKEAWIEGYNLDTKSKQQSFPCAFHNLKNLDIEGVGFDK